MGLIVKDLAEIAEIADPARSLYIYLLDYGWPDGEYERIFSEQWSKLCERASETGSIVIRSQRGVHFANSVLNWHSLAGREIENVLPAILLTKSPPSYFSTEPRPAKMIQCTLPQRAVIQHGQLQTLLSYHLENTVSRLMSFAAFWKAFLRTWNAVESLNSFRRAVWMPWSLNKPFGTDFRSRTR